MSTSTERPNAYTYKHYPYRCRHCGWQGLGKDLLMGEAFRDLFELDCPSCHERVAIVEYPTLEESHANWDKVPEADKMVIGLVEYLRAEFKRRMLKGPEQLPDVPDEAFVLTWDNVGEGLKIDTVVSKGDAVLFSEPSYYENYDRFIEVAKILRERYGERIRDLIPTWRSKDHLYGDRLSAPSQVDDARRSIFGVTGNLDEIPEPPYALP